MVGVLGALCLPPFCTFHSFVFSSLPVAGSIPRPTFVSLVSFLFFACLVLLFGALPSSPPDVSPVPTSSWAGLPRSFYSALSPSSYTSFGISPLPSVSGDLLLPGLLPVMLPCLMCWLRLLALPLQSLLPSIFLMSSFLPLQVFVWALWWLQVLWCKILMIIVFIPFWYILYSWEWVPSGGGGGGCSLSSALRRALFFVEGSQWQFCCPVVPGLANSL